jgi:radical SAM superfamily enzyme YgiQ (UPF0313 family)
MKKVALINPGRDERYAIEEPLSLGFIASYLEKNHVDVIIIDELAGDNVEEMIDDFRPDIVGITATTPLVIDAYRIADMCRRKRLITVMGGVHVSILPEEALQHADIVVIGEGEDAMLDIVNNNIESRIITRPYIKNIDEVPSPSRHLMNMKFYLCTKDRIPGSYLYFVPDNSRVACIITSRGCPYNCLFCHNTWKGIPYRSNSPDRVISEILSLLNNYNINALFFIDDNFFINKKRVGIICKKIIEAKLDILWGANARVDNIDKEVLQIAKEAGCKQITFGFESGSQRILDLLNKLTTVEQNRKAIDLCNSVGIIPQGTFIIGNPTETMEDINLTKKFIEENNIESAGICIATAFPGTDLWKWCKENNLIPADINWSDFTFDKVAIRICEEVSPKKLVTIRDEINRITFFRKGASLHLSKIINSIIQYPIRSIKMLIYIFKKPSVIMPFLRRLKI